MSAATMVSFRTPVLPWTLATDDEIRFRRITQRVLLLCAVIFIAMPWLPVFKPDPAKPVELAAPMARLLIEQAAVPPPPPVVIKPTPEAAKPLEREVASKKPEPEKPASRRPSAPAKVAMNKEAPVPEARVPVPDKPPGEIDAARRKVAGIGLLAMKDDVQELHGAPVAVQLRTDIKQGPGVGTSTGVGVGAGNEAGVPTRNLITSNATGGSGGINTAAYSKNTGGGGLAGRSTTLVEGAIGGGGGGGAGGGGARGRGDGTGSGIGGSGGPGGNGAGGNVTRGGGGKASRSIEDVRLVFERNKGSIYAIYNRALREEPGLQGKVVLKLVIAPEGNVIDVRIESSDLKTPELEAKLLARIRQFDFGAKDVNQMVVSYPVDFLPS
jgi:TonB family protein